MVRVSPAARIACKPSELVRIAKRVGRCSDPDLRIPSPLLVPGSDPQALSPGSPRALERTHSVASMKFLQRFGGVLNDEVDGGGELALVEPTPTHPLEVARERRHEYRPEQHAHAPLRGAARARRLRSRSPRTPSWRPSPQSRGDLRGNIRVVCVQRSNLAGRPVFPVPIRFWRHRLRAGAAQSYPVRQGARSASLVAQSRGFAVGARRKHRESRHVEGVVGRHEDSHLCTSAP